MRSIPLRLSAHEARDVRRGLMFVVWGALGLGVWWWSPWSPDAIARPTTLRAWGFPHLALRAYEDLGGGLAPADTRAEALWRGASLAAGDLDDPNKAIELLRALVNRHPRSPRALAAWDWLATLYDLRSRDPLRAAECWQAGAELAPTDPGSPARWLRAGLAFARAREPERAESALRLATRWAESAPEAWLALGELLLPRDPVAAGEAFQRALANNATGTTATLARLGVVTALERADRHEAALSQVEAYIELGDADGALLARKRRLEERSSP